MTWTNRLRLFGGMLGIILLVAILTLIFNQRQSSAASDTATIKADTYEVGAAYGGTVIKQYVNEGDSVTKGDNLFTLQSVALQQDLSNGLKIVSSDAYAVNKTDATVTYKATVSGTVNDLKAKLGNNLGTGQPFADITVTGSQFVEARYLLTPRDYERIEKGASVEILLPNNAKVGGTVTSVKVATDKGKAATKVRIDSPELAKSELSNLTTPGTPVVATLQLRDDGPFSGVSDLTFNFLRQIGLR